MYIDIFDEIVDIMRNDYAGCIDKKGWDTPNKYRERIYKLEQQGQLNDYQFVNIVYDYLLDFQDPHLFFISTEDNSEANKDIGFKVRRFKNDLYVVDVSSEDRIRKGDKIVSLDGSSMTELDSLYKRELMGKPPERQKWEKIMEKHNLIRIENIDNEYVDINLRLYEKKKYTPIHKVDILNEETMLITLSDFISPEPIVELLKDNEQRLTNLKNLIIDVRNNHGGSDSSFSQLLPYIFPTGTTSINLKNYKMDFNVTERTAELQKTLLHELQEKTEDESFKETLRSMSQFFENNSGKGFVPIDSDDTFDIQGLEHPKKVVILSDIYCGSAGDIFVDFASSSDKVTIIGRETAGLNDYSNLLQKDWNDKFSLYYPTSRMQYLDKEIKDNGVKPDIFLEWNPDHILKDIDMETALKFLE